MTDLAAGRDVIVAHASNVHVDDNYTASLFAGDGTGGLRAVVDAAQRAQADILLLAGDTFDCHRLPDHVLERTAEAMHAYKKPIVLLPGNHDPAVEDAVFHHPAISRIDTLHILGVTHDDSVRFDDLDLEVCGLAHRDYFDMEPLAINRLRSTRFQITMAHGHYTPVPDRETLARPSWLIGDADIEATQADYIALGHWNRRIQVGSGNVPAWYSGSPDYARSINIVGLTADRSVQVGREPLALPEGFGAGIIDV